ncbi:alpha/beta fold hydrolase [Spirosoma sp. KNUC1025]|uniref:alpha/beta fold hydrolase n=1 Tax=Spirosoma sp. KNUC1025 TaxID=2894082 RepID=UPI003869DD30|nr:alpha/beta hydrolase [Spirosoma sp. KNUC1025]
MKKRVVFIHGGGEEDYAADAKLAASLQERLGEAYVVHYPLLPNESEPDLGRKKQIGHEISKRKGAVILVGHSLGASMLLKYVSEKQIRKKITGLFLLATPFWHGEETWKQGFKLQEDFAGKLPKHVPIFLYQSQDDEVVPIGHLTTYTQHLPQATVRLLTSGGHQFNNDLSVVANDIKALENQSM